MRKLVTFTDGRRVVYLYSMPCFALGSFGVSWSRSVPELLLWRSLQAAGTSASLSTGMAVIGDIYKLEERGTAVGITWGVRFFLILPRGGCGLEANCISLIGFLTWTSGCPTYRRNCDGVRSIDPLS